MRFFAGNHSTVTISAIAAMMLWANVGMGQTSEATTIGQDGTVMALIPEGKFQMGSNYDETERPIHTVYLDAFYMDAYEVTNAQYKKFVDVNPQWSKDQIDPQNQYRQKPGSGLHLHKSNHRKLYLPQWISSRKTPEQQTKQYQNPRIAFWLSQTRADLFPRR